MSQLIGGGQTSTYGAKGDASRKIDAPESGVEEVSVNGPAPTNNKQLTTATQQ